LPFVSKTLDTNFIEIATNIMINNKYNPAHIKIEDLEYVAIKVPVFSFNRLPNVDPILGVEMASTGEIASFGYDVKETYIKALCASGFKIPQKNILVSIGNDVDKYEMLNSIKLLKEMGYNLYCTSGTHKFLLDKKIKNAYLEFKTITTYIQSHKIELLINIPNNIFSSNNNTQGFYIRRKCIDYDIPVITNIKCAKLFVSSLKIYFNGSCSYKSWDEYIK